MKKVCDLGRIIARRELTLSDAGTLIRIAVGEPRQQSEDEWICEFASEDEWICPFTIEGIGETISSYVIGVDSLSCLQFVSKGIRYEIEKKNVNVEFLGNSNWQSHFPKPIMDYGEVTLREGLEALVIDEQTRWLKANKPKERNKRRT